VAASTSGSGSTCPVSGGGMATRFARATSMSSFEPSGDSRISARPATPIRKSSTRSVTTSTLRVPDENPRAQSFSAFLAYAGNHGPVPLALGLSENVLGSAHSTPPAHVGRLSLLIKRVAEFRLFRHSRYPRLL